MADKPINKNHSTETQLALMAQSIENINKSLVEINAKIEKMNSNLILRSEFAKLEEKVEKNEEILETHLQEFQVEKSELSNVKKIVYGAVGLTLTSVLMALIGLVIISTR